MPRNSCSTHIRTDARSLLADFPKCYKEDFTTVEIAKLPVGQVLDQLRSGTDAAISTFTQLDEKIKTAQEEAKRLRAARRRLEWGQPQREFCNFFGQWRADLINQAPVMLFRSSIGLAMVRSVSKPSPVPRIVRQRVNEPAAGISI